LEYGKIRLTEDINESFDFTLHEHQHRYLSEFVSNYISKVMVHDYRLKEVWIKDEHKEKDTQTENKDQSKQPDQDSP